MQQDVEELIVELKALLNWTMLDDESIRKDVESLEQWKNDYCVGEASCDITPLHSTSWFTDLHDRLKLAADEMHRLESEGGNPPDKEQAAKTEALLKAIRRIDKIGEVVHNEPTPLKASA